MCGLSLSSTHSVNDTHEEEEEPKAETKNKGTGEIGVVHEVLIWC